MTCHGRWCCSSALACSSTQVSCSYVVRVSFSIAHPSPSTNRPGSVNWVTFFPSGPVQIQCLFFALGLSRREPDLPLDTGPVSDQARGRLQCHGGTPAAHRCAVLSHPALCPLPCLVLSFTALCLFDGSSFTGLGRRGCHVGSS